MRRTAALFEGTEVNRSYTTLKEEAEPGTTRLVVDPGLDWSEGDEIAIAPSGYSVDEREIQEILTYDPDSGEIELKEELRYYHYGSSIEKSVYSLGSFSLAAEVALLSRNIIINAGHDVNFGCTILVTEWGD